MSGLTALARERGLHAAGITAIGAFSRAVPGYFDRDRTEYQRIPVEEQAEVLTLEVVLTEVPAELQKTHDPETGLALLDLPER